jgi:hypothetical protein
MEINDTNSIATADKVVQMSGGLDLGGVLLVTNLGPNPMRA